MIGQSLGHYQILGKLGAGGMGEVYRAEDTRLRREVAIKVLPQRLAGDAERMARLTWEARTLAALNHPNVGAIYTASKSPAPSAIWSWSWFGGRL
jgi:serine/threonine-protein kinase